METQTLKALAAVTDAGQFERIATAVLRLTPEYEGLAHTGINPDGKTRKSPVDGLWFLGEGGSRLVATHYTTTDPGKIERKWLLDPATVKRRKGGKSAAPISGDVVKTIEIVRGERAAAPHLAATLVLATNQEPDEEVIRKAVAAGRAADITVDVWTRSRIAAKLDMDPRGQYIRRKLLGIQAELLSRPLLEDLSAASLAEFDAGDDQSLRVPRGLDEGLLASAQPLTFIVAPSGSGKTVACHKVMQAHRDSGDVALILPHEVLEGATSLEQAIVAALLRLDPRLALGQNVLAFFSEEDPLYLLVEDVSRSNQPQFLIEKLAGWAPESDNHDKASWKMFCPVWPHLTRSVRSQFRQRVEAMSLRPNPMSPDEATMLVETCARKERVSIDTHRARQIAATLGFDPLLISLNHDWRSPSSEQVIARFAEDALVRCAIDSTLLAADLHHSLMALSKAMLNARLLDPTWNEVLSLELPAEIIAALRILAQHAELVRIESMGSGSQLRFRHDRVRDWLLVSAAQAMAEESKLSDSILSDPALAEIVGALLVRAEATEDLLERIKASSPLALFHALRNSADDSVTTRRIAEAAMEWLRDPANHSPATATLRWQAMAAIEEVKGDYLLDLIELFDATWPMGLIARLRNGDVEGGVELSLRYELSSVVYWTRSALAASKSHSRKMVRTLSDLLDDDADSIEGRRRALIEFAGVIGAPLLAPALERLWARDHNRVTNLGVYLWAMARCATPSTAQRLLDPVCAAWGALPAERADSQNLPSPRDELAAHSIRFGFERAIPTGAIDYFIQRAKQPDLCWQIEYLLHGVDHPKAILFEVECGAKRLRKGDKNYYVMNQALNHWGRGLESWGVPMSPDSRKVLLALWQDVSADDFRRRVAFDLWAASRGSDDLAVLRPSADDSVLGDRVFRQRLLRGDTLAIPSLVERLDAENGLRWWSYTQHVWSSALYEALDRALANATAVPSRDENTQYEIGATLTRPILRLPPPDAERLLLRYWGDFGETKHFVQSALYVGTDELLEKAANVIASHEKPESLFEHFTFHFGIRMAGEAGITSQGQIRALAPYFSVLRPRDVMELAEVCNENGWQGLRRELIDPHLPENDLPDPQKLRGELDDYLEHLHPGPIEHCIDDLLKAGISWSLLVDTLSDWIAIQPSPHALAAAKQAILHAGSLGDAALLNLWPGKDERLQKETSEDLRFALRRRIRGTA